jgi:hypothetical protein
MSESARVTSIDALRDFRTALCEFGVDAQEALAGADMDIRHAQDWLHEQLEYWRRQVRDRGEGLARAKAALIQREWGSQEGKGAGTTEAEIEVKRAKRHLEEADDKIKAVRRWQQLLPRAINEYEGPARQLSGFLEADLKQALTILDRMAAALEEYVALASPSAPGPVLTTPASDNNQASGVPESVVRRQKPEVRGQKSEVTSQK